MRRIGIPLCWPARRALTSARRVAVASGASSPVGAGRHRRWTASAQASRGVDDDVFERDGSVLPGWGCDYQPRHCQPLRTTSRSVVGQDIPHTEYVQRQTQCGFGRCARRWTPGQPRSGARPLRFYRILQLAILFPHPFSRRRIACNCIVVNAISTVFHDRCYESRGILSHRTALPWCCLSQPKGAG